MRADEKRGSRSLSARQKMLLAQDKQDGRARRVRHGQGEWPRGRDPRVLQLQFQSKAQLSKVAHEYRIRPKQ